RRRPDLGLMALEPRWMFDGAAAVDATHAAPDAAALALIPSVAAPVEVRAADSAQNNGKTEVVFVDTSVADYKTLEAAVKAGVEIEEIDGSKSGLAQMAKWAETHAGYDSISVLSHGAEGIVRIGGDTLTDASLTNAVTQAELAEIGHSLKVGGDLLLYGCDVAKGADGQTFITDLATATGADVAASADNTGSATVGGNWILEKSTADIAATPFDPGNTYTHLLDAPTCTNINAIVWNVLNVTNADEIDFQVNFDQGVSGVADYNFSLSGTSTGGYISNVVDTWGDGSNWTVTVKGARSDGTLAVDLTDTTGIVSLADGTAMAGTHACDQGAIVDITPPTITSVTLNSNRYKLGDTVTVTITTGAYDGYGAYRLQAGLVDGQSLTGWTYNTSTLTGTASFTVTSSTTEVMGGTVPIYIQIFSDYVGNMSTPYVSGVLSTVIDARAPTNITIAGQDTTTHANTLMAANSTVGALTTLDGSPGDSFTYAISGTDAAKFQISGTTLKVASGVTLTSGSTYSITLQTTDLGGNTYSKAYTITALTQPSVVSINRDPSTPAVTNSSTAKFDVVFSQAVTGVTASKFALSGTKTGGTITGATSSDGGITWVVTTSGATNGTLGLNLTNTSGITAVSGGTALSGTHTSDQTVTLDNIVPTITSVTTSASRYKLGDTVTATITTGTYDGNGAYTLAAGSTLDGMTLSGWTYNTATNSGTATFTVTSATTEVYNASLATNIRVTDAAGNNSAAYTTAIAGKTIDRTAPAISTVTLNAGTYKLGDTVTATITPVAAYDGHGAYTLGAGSTIDGMTLSGWSYNTGTGIGTASFTVTGATTEVINGSVATNITIADFVGNASAAYTTAIPSKTIDAKAPTDLSLSSSTCLPTANGNAATLSATDATTGDTFAYTLVAGNGSNDTDNGKFTISGSSLLVGGTDLVDGAIYNIFVRVADVGGNTFTKALTITARNPSLNVSSINRHGGAAALTGGASVQYDVTFSGAAANVALGNFSLTSTGSAAGTISSVTDSGDHITYTVSVIGLGGDGTMRLDLSSIGTIQSATGAIALSATHAGDQTFTLDHTAPTITGLTLNAAAYKQGDTVTATIVTDAHDGHGAYGLTGTIDGLTLTGWSYNTATHTGTASFVVGAGATEVVNGALATSITVADGLGNSSTYTTPIVGKTIDTHAPTALAVAGFAVGTPPTGQVLPGAGSVVGTISVTDATPGETFTFTLGGADAARFVVAGNVLKVAPGQTLTPGTAYAVTVSVRDAGGNVLATPQALSITAHAPPQQDDSPTHNSQPTPAPSPSTPTGGPAPAQAPASQPTPVVTVFHDTAAISQINLPPPTATVVATGPVSTTGVIGGDTGRAGNAASAVAGGVQAPAVVTFAASGQLTASAGDGGAFRVPVIAQGQRSGGGDSLLAVRPVAVAQETVSGSVSFALPVDTFAHTRADAVVTLKAAQADGQPLPPWLAFDPKTGAFAGTPPADLNGVVVIRVVARDQDGREAIATVRINLVKGDAASRPAQDRVGHIKPVGKLAFTQQIKMASRIGSLGLAGSFGASS
ncbi:hypothetical protein CU669_20840, partial [Paramagnetospirillum kuznetsovii]